MSGVSWGTGVIFMFEQSQSTRLLLRKEAAGLDGCLKWFIILQIPGCACWGTYLRCWLNHNLPQSLQNRMGLAWHVKLVGFCCRSQQHDTSSVKGYRYTQNDVVQTCWVFDFVTGTWSWSKSNSINACNTSLLGAWMWSLVQYFTPTPCFAIRFTCFLMLRDDLIACRSRYHVSLQVSFVFIMPPCSKWARIARI